MSDFHGDVKQLNAKIGVYKLILVILATLNLLMFGLMFVILNAKDVTIELPPVPITESMMINSSHPSDGFFKTWGDWITPLLTNISPDTIDANFNILKKMLYPARYAEISLQLDKLEKDCVSNRVREVYWPTPSKTTIKVTGPYAEYTMIGDAQRYIGAVKQDYKYKYTIKMYIQNMHFYIIGFHKEILK